MKKHYISLIATFFLIGCGNSNSSSSEVKLKKVKVVDSYVVKAKVCDEKSHCAMTDSNGVAEGEFDINSTLTAVGGFLDKNFNGIKDSDEIDAPLLKAPSNSKVITPITTLLVNGADINKLSKILNVSKEEILEIDPIETKNIKLIKIFNAIYPVLVENKVDELVKKINSYENNNNNVMTDLPLWNKGEVNIYSLVTQTIKDPTHHKFLSYLQNINNDDFNDVIKNIEQIKANPLLLNNNINNENITNMPNNSNSSHTSNVSNNSNTPSLTNNSNSSKNNSTSKNSISTNSKTDLPDFGAPPPTPNITLTSNDKTDLPDFGKEPELIDTNVEYNPQYTPLPKQYFIKLESFDKFIEMKKISDKEYKFKNPFYFNTNDKDFNATKIFDINATYLFDDINYSIDGKLDGNIFINLKDVNSSNEVNFTIHKVKYKILNSKLIQSDLSSADINVSSNDKNSSYSLNAGIFDKYDINLSKVLKDYNESEFNITNHLYKFSIDYNISNTILKLEGEYKPINTIPPKISLNQYSFIVTKNSDINLTIGYANIPNVNCKVEGINLNCKVDNNKAILLYGHTPNEIAIKSVTITLDNQGYSDSKSLYLEVLNPANNQILKEWDLLADGNYTGKRVFIGIDTSLSNNIIDVNTSKENIPNGVPENNVTVYLRDSNGNYAKFIFDANVYSSSDWFIIKRGDNKEVKFRVGEVSPSNNTFDFK